MNLIHKRILYMFSFLFIVLAVGAGSSTAVSDTAKEELTQEEIDFKQIINNHQQGMEMVKLAKNKSHKRSTKIILQKIITDQKKDLRKLVLLQNSLPKNERHENKTKQTKNNLLSRNGLKQRFSEIQSKLQKLLALSN